MMDLILLLLLVLAVWASIYLLFPDCAAPAHQSPRVSTEAEPSASLRVQD
jgi:hypothetical protein